MLDKEWESVFEEIVGTLLKRNSSKAVEETLVSFLQFLGEGLVGVVGSGGHIEGYSKRSAEAGGCEEGGYFSIVAVLEASRVARPA